MGTDNTSIPGMVYPTQKSMIAGTPGDSAIAAQANRNALQATANKAMTGGKFRRVGGSTIAVPQYIMPYESQGGVGTNPNNQIQQNAMISTQGAENSSMDKNATKIGGSRKRKIKRGGNSDWNWGCYSGGRTRSKKSRKMKKRRKNKSRKLRKYRR
jgi:hypothetical protein